MSAWDEARAAGGLGPHGVRLLYETVDAVRRFSGFPPPPGHEQWDFSAVTAIAHDFLAGADRVAAILLRAVDDDSFERLLHAAVRNYLRSEYRKTAAGRMMRSLRRVVEGDDTLVSLSSGHWAVASYADRPVFGGRESDLVDAAFAVDDVRLARWRAESRNRPPIAETQSLRRVIRAVLEAAQAPVAPATVLRVIAERFPPAETASLALSEVAEAESPANGTDEPAAGLLAQEVWDQLSENERVVAGVLDEPVREVAALTGLSRGTAHRAILAAKEALAGYLVDVDEPQAIIAELRTLSDLAREAGTRRATLASYANEEP